MSVDRTVGRLLWCYPTSWRSRYGEELETLIADMTGDGPVPWRVRRDVLAGGARERMVSALGGRRQRPEERTIGGTVLVLWAWALFVVGGSIVGKTAEHWQDAVPGGPTTPASWAFGVLTVGAVAAAVVVLAGIGWGSRSFLAFLRDGGWPQIRRPVLVAVAMTVLTTGATVGLVMLARSVDGGEDIGPGLARAAFLGWAALGVVWVFSWVAAASATARRLDLSSPTLRVESYLATAVAVAMGLMTVATGTWWLTVARAAPGALTGGSDGGAVPPELVVAVVLMLTATAVGGVGARHASTARNALPGR